MYHKEKICIRCGNKFIALTANAIRCEKCRTLVRNERQVKWYYDNKDREKPDPPKKHTLDDRLREIRAQGISYAEAQRRETLKGIAKVEV